ncbi:putative fungal specific transcription factor domain-containing protein [Lasiodiplodia theobromae]|uniref:Fungal specific transcription factor domain-containing protein n=2 Tax=Lasiodiplodia theobromae TaxID=45133 RepID=A0A8H7MAJ8_9PEZI|nr:putative fungal specific transcription factor domain-containing protein [Lasiodiplodia theobromae]
MPCGARDRRRSGHRCMRCQKDHVKCDGRRPCSYCSARGINCISPPPSASDITIIEYASKKPARRPQAQVQKALVQDSWRYTSAFFQAIGLSASPIMSVFSFDSIGGLSQGNELVSKTVSVVGGMYASRNANLLALNAAEKREIHKAWAALKTTIGEEMRGTRSTQFNAVLLCASLSGFNELLSDKTGKTWRALVREIGEYVRQNGRSREAQGEFESALVRFLRMSDALGAILMCEDIALPMNRPVFTLQVELGKDIPLSPERRWDELLDILEKWAILQFRALSWAVEAERHGFPSIEDASTPGTEELVTQSSDCVSSQHATVGIEIICQASRLQREIITSILSFADQDPQDLDAGTLSTIPYYHWGLTGLSRLFLHPAWSALNCELPVMNDEMIRKQAIAALDYAEGRLSRVELEAVMYMPITHLVGLEMKAAEERKRVLDFLSVIKNKGFDIAATFESDLQTAWTGMVPSCDSKG